MTPKGQGRSLNLLQLTYNVPTATAELVPIAQYHRMVWKAATRSTDMKEGKGPSLPMLRELWTKAERSFGPLVARTREARISEEMPGRKKGTKEIHAAGMGTSQMPVRGHNRHPRADRMAV